MGLCPECGAETEVQGMSNLDERVCPSCGWMEGRVSEDDQREPTAAERVAKMLNEYARSKGVDEVVAYPALNGIHVALFTVNGTPLIESTSTETLACRIDMIALDNSFKREGK